MNWININEVLPPEGAIVMTTIDDSLGVRKPCKMKKGPGPLWFYPDGSLVPGYRPTHWAWV